MKQRVRNGLTFFSAAILIISLPATISSAANKLGEKCSKKGQTTVIDGVMAKCNPDGKKLYWVSMGKPAQQSPSNSNSDSSKYTFDPSKPPQLVVADFINPNKVYLLSKFRSGIGHDFSVDSGETCRSMKHYFSAQDATAPDYKIENGGGKDSKPLPVIGVDVPIYSPADGIYSVENLDSVLFNRSVDNDFKNNSAVRVRFMHVTPLSTLKDGQLVKAGQQIGLILRNQTFDVAVEFQNKSAKNKMTFLSIFSLMTDSVFAEWQKRGVTTRDSLILTKAEVDANPWKCNIDPKEKPGNYQFSINYMTTTDGFARSLVTLKGYDEVNKLLQEKFKK